MKIETKNILVLSAHPDDETIGCGSTIAKLALQENNIHVVTFTDGVSARNGNFSLQDIEGRRNAARYVRDILKISSFDFGKFTDNKMDSFPLLDVCRFIERCVKYEPDIIFTHHPGCLNIDHSVVYRATVTVFRPQYGNNHVIYSYYVPSSTDYSPFSNFVGNSYSVVSEKDVDRKKSALLSYAREMRQYPHSRSVENILRIMKVWGSEIGADYAEKFQLVRSVF